MDPNKIPYRDEEYYNNLCSMLRNYHSLDDILQTQNIDLIKVALECRKLGKHGFYVGMNPLPVAISIDNHEIVKLLIDNGFNPNEIFEKQHHKKFIQVERPLFSSYWLSKNYDKIIKILVEAGANINAPDYYCKVCDCDGLFCSDEFSHRCKNDVDIVCRDAPDCCCKFCDCDGLFWYDKFSHRCENNVDNVCRDVMIKALCGSDEKIVDCMINNGYNYKNRRLITYLKHPRFGIFANNWDTMYRLYSLDEKYFYEELSQDGYFADECKRNKNTVIHYGENQTLESFYKSQTKKHRGVNVISLLVFAYYYDKNFLLNSDYFCLDLFRLILKEFETALVDLCFSSE